MDLKERYTEVSLMTAENIRTIARSSMLRDLSHLSLPKIDAIVDLVAQVVPAGNVPGVILNGLARLSGRKLPAETVKRDIDLLFKGAEQALDKVVYGAFFAGPAAVIWGYQNLLKLVGKGLDAAFPEGTWQFYTGYALREDSARHAYETHGFDSLLNHHKTQLDAVDRATAWTMTVIHSLHQYEDLLANEWRERTYTYLLREITQNQPDAAHYAGLYRTWEKLRPFKRGADASPEDNYPTYRRRKFEAFLKKETEGLSSFLRSRWRWRIRSAERRELPAYLRQMSILAYLNPGTYDETRIPLPLADVHIGLIHKHCYYLVPACAPGTSKPADVNVVREQIAALLLDVSEPPPVQRLAVLSRVRRSAIPKLLDQIDKKTAKGVTSLRLAPILINFDKVNGDLPLSEVRRSERGIGDHAMTLLDTGKTMVFDLSHIFFDGAWGAALSEVMTNEALSWAVYLNSLPSAQAGEKFPHTPACHLSENDLEIISQAPRLVAEVSAEDESVDLKAILKLRKLFKQRNELIKLTVNDLLVLYRAIHALTYEPSPDLAQKLQTLTQDDDTLSASLQVQASESALATLEAIQKRVNPGILIPVDASQRSPKERLYPMTFETPLKDLELLELHEKIMAALDDYERAAGDRTGAYAEFDELQRTYLAALAGFGALMSRSKEIALKGESASVGSIKMLAHIPAPLQRMLDKIPGRFDVLNDIIKGSEVFSNVGVVAPSSTLTRFITAKDDNDKKMLAWSVITDARGVMQLSLRDFRPHVGLLFASGQDNLAREITEEYLASYAHGLNNFVADFQRITRKSRGSSLHKPEQNHA